MRKISSCSNGKVVMALALASCVFSITPAHADAVGWVTLISPTVDASSAITVKRKGAAVAYDEKTGLLACDEVLLKNDQVKVQIRLSNNERIVLDSMHPRYGIPCDRRSVADKFFAFLMAVTKKSEARNSNIPIVTITRAENSQTLPIIYSLVADRAVVLGGEKALYLTWGGGVPPYSIEITQYSDNRLVISRHNINENAVTLPKTKLQLGRYTLELKDARDNGIKEDQFYVADKLPPMPAELANAVIPDTDKTLFYADYLVGLEDGRWTLEAIQQAASIAEKTPAARTWLKSWGR